MTGDYISWPDCLREVNSCYDRSETVAKYLDEKELWSTNSDLNMPTTLQKFYVENLEHDDE